MAKFKIKDQDDKQRIVETDYYKWLSENEKNDVHFVKTKVKYLESCGFIWGIDFISTEDLERLKAIEQHYSYGLNKN